jgi:hypothetical protein
MTVDKHTRNGTAGDGDRDARLDRLYREAALEEPPARLDAAIRAAARREVGARPRALAWGLRSWRIPVSIAAVVVLSVSLVTLVSEEGGEPLSPSPPGAPFLLQLPPSETAKGATPSPDVAATPERPASRDDTRGSTSAGMRGTENRALLDEAQPAARDSGRQSAPEMAARTSPQPFQSVPGGAGKVAAVPSTAGPLAGAPAVSAERSARPTAASPAPDAPRAPTEPVQRQAAPMEVAKPIAKPAPRLERDAAPGEATGTASSMRAPAAGATLEQARPKPIPEARLRKSENLLTDTAPAAALLKELDTQPPEKWLERIDELRRKGRAGEADAVLAEFRRRFPQHPVPPGLQAK